jgi:hypothetical protein
MDLFDLGIYMVKFRARKLRVGEFGGAGGNAGAGRVNGGTREQQGAREQRERGDAAGETCEDAGKAGATGNAGTPQGRRARTQGRREQQGTRGRRRGTCGDAEGGSNRGHRSLAGTLGCRGRGGREVGRGLPGGWGAGAPHAGKQSPACC